MHRQTQARAQARARPPFFAEDVNGAAHRMQVSAAMPLQDGAAHRCGVAMGIRKRSADVWRQSE
eukprot:10172750-Alexandrium_andersonii.AAC.1